MVKRLRHRPFTAVSGVRFPLRSPTYGRLAQLGERLPYKQNVSSSILLAPTTKEDDTCVTLYRLFYMYFLAAGAGLTEQDCRATPGVPCREGFELKAGIFLFISNNIY